MYDVDTIACAAPAAPCLPQRRGARPDPALWARRSGRQPPRRRRQRSAGGCKLCAGGHDRVDWKNVQLLNDYVGEFGTLTTRRQNGLCRRHHSAVAQAIKRARHMAFLPFVGKPAK